MKRILLIPLLLVACNGTPTPTVPPTEAYPPERKEGRERYVITDLGRKVVEEESDG